MDQQDGLALPLHAVGEVVPVHGLVPELEHWVPWALVRRRIALNASP